MGKHKTFMTFENKSFTSYLAYFRQMSFMSTLIKIHALTITEDLKHCKYN